MDGGRAANWIRFGYRGHSYCVILIEKPDDYWTWSYVLHDTPIASVEEPAKRHLAAIGQAMRAATAHIDRLIG